MDVTNVISWGISNLDVDLRLPSNVFNILQAPDEVSSLIVLAHFLEAGLKNNEKVAMVSFDNPQATQQLFQQFGFDFSEALESENFFYLYYLPDFSQKTSFVEDYRKLFQEIEKMCLDKVDRVAFTSVHNLINLQSYNQALSTSQKLFAASSHLPYTVLGSFYESNSIDSRLLDTSCKNSPSYFEMTKVSNNDDQSYQLDIKRSLMLTMGNTVELNLMPGKGFVKKSQKKRRKRRNRRNRNARSSVHG